MKRLRIYGSEPRCRTAVARYIDGGEEILDQAVGVRNRLAAATAGRRTVNAIFIENAWAKDVRRWFLRAQRGMRQYLQEQLEDVLPLLASGLPPPDGKPRHGIALDNGEPWLREALDELREFQAVLGVRRGVATSTTAPARFQELHASGLVGEKVIDDHAKDMLAPRTPKQLHNAIGSAKELTEATLRAALDRLGEQYGRRDDLPSLMKKWRTAVGKLAPPDPEGARQRWTRRKRRWQTSWFFWRSGGTRTAEGMDDRNTRRV